MMTIEAIKTKRKQVDRIENKQRVLQSIKSTNISNRIKTESARVRVRSNKDGDICIQTLKISKEKTIQHRNG